MFFHDGSYHSVVKVWSSFPFNTAFNACAKADGGEINNDNVSCLEHVLALIAGAIGSSVK